MDFYGRSDKPAELAKKGRSSQAAAVNVKDTSNTQIKQGAAGITTAAPHIADQWGRGDDRLPGLR
jgi:hypothetical protein